MTREQLYLLVLIARMMLEEKQHSADDEEGCELLRKAIKAVEAQATP